MANCCNCGAPLSLKSSVCTYCNSLNDVDLRRKPTVAAYSQQMNRICPRCNCKLLTINISGNEPFLIERCELCFGLFFDLGELEEYLSFTYTIKPEINHHSLNLLSTENYHKDYPVGYIKCPLCEALMNRINYGKKSGVVVNKCSLHGVWLDSGLLNHLIGWAKAGGFELDKNQKDEDNRKEITIEKIKKEKLRMNYDTNSLREIGLVDLAKIIIRFFT